MTKRRLNPEKMREAGWTEVIVPLWAEHFFKAMAEDHPEDTHEVPPPKDAKGMAPTPKVWLRNKPLETWLKSYKNMYAQWRKEFFGRA